MVKFIIIFGIGYLAYRALKAWMFQGNSSSSDLSKRSAGQIDDIMVKDPVCEAYLAKKEGILFKFHGETLYFCSTDCRDKFITEQSEIENNAR